MESRSEDIYRALDQQYDNYEAMCRLSLDQWECIVREDLPGLNITFNTMHQLIERIHSHQEKLPTATLAQAVRRDSAVAERTDRNRRIILKLIHLRDKNEEHVRLLLDQTRTELRQFGQVRKAARSYCSPPVESARFYDGIR